MINDDICQNKTSCCLKKPQGIILKKKDRRWSCVLVSFFDQQPPSRLSHWSSRFKNRRFVCLPSFIKIQCGEIGSLLSIFLRLLNTQCERRKREINNVRHLSWCVRWLAKKRNTKEIRRNVLIDVSLFFCFLNNIWPLVSVGGLWPVCCFLVVGLFILSWRQDLFSPHESLPVEKERE